MIIGIDHLEKAKPMKEVPV